MQQQYDKKEDELLQIDKLLEESIKEINSKDSFNIKEQIQIINNKVIDDRKE